MTGVAAGSKTQGKKNCDAHSSKKPVRARIFTRPWSSQGKPLWTFGQVQITRQVGSAAAVKPHKRRVHARWG